MIEMAPVRQVAPIYTKLLHGLATIEDAEKIAHYLNGKLMQVVIKPRPPRILPAPAGMRHLFRNGEPIAPMPGCRINGVEWVAPHGLETIYLWYEDQANADD